VGLISLRRGHFRHSATYQRPTSDGHLAYDAHMSEDRLSEDYSAGGGFWPFALRATMRDAVFRIPLKESICDDCVVAFWDNVWKRSEAQRRLAKDRG
jgi:hypothetical protein